ncbi:MAG: hypothetical protein ACE5K4_01005 [Candidatus Hydrothermarchaeota archaeon]
MATSTYDVLTDVSQIRPKYLASSNISELYTDGKNTLILLNNGEKLIRPFKFGITHLERNFNIKITGKPKTVIKYSENITFKIIHTMGKILVKILRKG